MELNGRERGHQRDGSCDCNSAGVSSVRETNDSPSQFLRPESRKQESGGGGRKTCLIDVTVTSLLRPPEPLRALDTSPDVGADEDDAGDLVSGSRAESLSSAPTLKRCRKNCGAEQRRSSCELLSRSGRTCLIKVTVANLLASTRLRSGDGLQVGTRGRRRPGGRRRAARRARDSTADTSASCPSIPEPLRALDTSSEGAGGGDSGSAADSSTSSSKDELELMKSRSPVLLKKRWNASRFRSSSSSSSGSSSGRHRSRRHRRRRVTMEGTPSDSKSPCHHYFNNHHQESGRPGGVGRNANNTTGSSQVTPAGAWGDAPSAPSGPDLPKATLLPAATVVITGAAGDAVDFQEQQQQKDEQQQQQQQLFTRSAESTRDSAGFSYNTVSTHVGDPWQPERDATGTLDGCADYSASAGGFRLAQPVRTTTTQSATPSTSSAAGAAAAAAAKADEEQGAEGRTPSDRLALRSQLNRLRRLIYGGGGSAPVLIQPVSFWGARLEEGRLPRFPATIEETFDNNVAIDKRPASELRANEQGAAATQTKLKIIKRDRAIQSLVLLPRPTTKQTAIKKQKTEKLKVQHPQQRQQQQQHSKKTAKKKKAAKKQTNSSPVTAPVKPAGKLKSKRVKLKAPLAIDTTKASSVKRASGAKFVTFSRPMYM